MVDTHRGVADAVRARGTCGAALAVVKLDILYAQLCYVPGGGVKAPPPYILEYSTDMLLHLPVTAATGLLCLFLLTVQMMTAAAGALHDAVPRPAALATMSTRRLHLSQPLSNLTVDYMPSEYLLLTTDRFVQMCNSALCSLLVDGYTHSLHWNRYAVVDHPEPLFGWVVPPAPSSERRGRNGISQDSYRVRVVLRTSAAGISAKPTWDSGEIPSNASSASFPAPGGKDMHAPLRPDSAYAFLVDLTLSDGSKLHGEGQFHTGLMNASISAWGGAEWLAGIAAHTHLQRLATKSHGCWWWQAPQRLHLIAFGGTICARSGNSVTHRPLRRPSWRGALPPPPVQLFDSLNAHGSGGCSIGYHELFCNGIRQGVPGAKLQPGYTNFEKRTYYIVYDLSHCLKAGNNSLGILLGNGWFSQGSENRSSPYATTLPGSRPVPPQMLLRARATVNDKSYVFISSSSSGKWTAADGPIVTDSLYNGEVYDARRELIDEDGRHFSHPLYDTEGVDWAPAAQMSWIPDTAQLVPQTMPPIRMI
eukprot:COSAG02_NODE_10714_length_1875_cov_3.233108_2_plen_533_part_01